MSQFAPIDFTRHQNVFILTGAGISVAAGLPTYRGPGGIWTTSDVGHIVDGRNLPDTLPDLWKLYGSRRQDILTAEPSIAHRTIAGLQKRNQGPTVTLVTQNIDGLHYRAGSPQVLELHGSGFRTRCTNRKCSSRPFADTNVYNEVPRCTVCGAFLRPDIVLFNENLPGDVVDQVLEGLSACDLFMAIGTSGVVAPASEFVRAAASIGARTININLEPSSNHAFGEEYIGPADDVITALFAGVPIAS